MISVIIPCFNCEAFLKRSIDSVLRQSVRDFEIILINNNSVDRTQEIIDSYCEAFPQLISGYEERRRGATFARNLGLQMAKGEWIQFLDADDEIEPAKFERQLMLLSENQSDLLLGSFTRHKKSGTKFELVDKHNNIWRSFAASELGITSANLYRASCVRDVEGWDESLSSCQEYDLLFKLIVQNIKICFDKESSANIYEVENSISRTTNKARIIEILDEYVKQRKELKSYLVKKNQLDDTTRDTIDLCIYRTMLGRKIHCEEYVSKQLKLLNLKVSLWQKLKLNLLYRLRKLKQWLS